MRFIYSALLLLPLSGLLLAATPASEVTSAPEAISAPPATITQLVLRDYKITISTGDDDGARYDVYTTGGEPLETGLNLEQFQASYPDVYDSLRPAVASDTEEADQTLMMLMPIDSETVGF